MIFDSDPLYNSILFYILFIVLIILLKPKFLFCKKSNQMKSFGFGKNQTIFCFPLVCIMSIVIFYIVFLGLDIVNKALTS